MVIYACRSSSGFPVSGGDCGVERKGRYHSLFAGNRAPDDLGNMQVGGAENAGLQLTPVADERQIGPGEHDCVEAFSRHHVVCDRAKLVGVRLACGSGRNELEINRVDDVEFVARGRITSNSLKVPNKSVSITKRVPKSAMRFNPRCFRPSRITSMMLTSGSGLNSCK
jgi:hypothetical protein